jgi:hypothetical protein
LQAGFRDFGVFASRSINLSAAECSSSAPISLLTGYMINGDFDGEVPSIMGHSRLYPSKPTPRALPSNLKRNLDRQADYHGKVRDLYDLAVEFEIVKNRGEFDNPTETQTSKIAFAVQGSAP